MGLSRSFTWALPPVVIILRPLAVRPIFAYSAEISKGIDQRQPANNPALQAGNQAGDRYSKFKESISGQDNKKHISLINIAGRHGGKLKKHPRRNSGPSVSIGIMPLGSKLPAMHGWGEFTLRVKEFADVGTKPTPANRLPETATVPAGCYQHPAGTRKSGKPLNLIMWQV